MSGASRSGAIELLAERGPELHRAALRLSLCPADADDAFQRAVEILLTKAPATDRDGLLAWMHVVLRREALAVRRLRRRLLAAIDDEHPAQPVLELDLFASPLPGPEEQLERRERTAAAAERLSILKAEERRAIGLQAAGCSYAEIQAITGWTYTKVNRSLAEGRARLRGWPSPADAC